MKPTIGITFTSSNIENNPNDDYIQAIEKFGGIPRMLYPCVPDSKFADINGLLLTGGPDVDPKHYNEKKHPKTQRPCRARDELEISLFNKAMETKIPVFGICRGIQIMSVVMGGSLFQHIPLHLSLQFSDFPIHKVNARDSLHKLTIQPDSLLNQITSERIAKVNSRHHQAVKVIGEGFVVSAQSKDGVIEAIENENPSKQFVLGVQYHPERMLKKPELKEHGGKLFKAFIKAASQ